MIKKLTSVFAISCLVAGLGYSQEAEKKAAPEMARKTAEAAWPEGNVSVNYGSPVWKDAYREQMKGMKDPWRLGNNQPTTATITCGLETAQGPLPPGEYRIALQPNADGTWDLLFYEAKAFYDKAFKTWTVKAAGPVSESKEVAGHMTLALDDKKNMEVRFGPMVSRWTLKPIKANKPVETDFANVATKFEVLALPLAGTTFKDTTVGVVTASMDDLSIRYHLKLTVDGEKSSLTLVNERAAAIPKEKEQIEGIVKRIDEMLGEHPERKDMAEPILAGFKKDLEGLDSLMKRQERLRSSQTIEGTVTKRDTPATELGLSHDRPQKAIVLKFALANGDAAFEIKPRDQFMKPREKKPE